MTEKEWNHFHKISDRRAVRQQRIRFIKRGWIVPAARCKPQMMLKDANGRWCPQLSIRSQ